MQCMLVREPDGLNLEGWDFISVEACLSLQRMPARCAEGQLGHPKKDALARKVLSRSTRHALSLLLLV